MKRWKIITGIALLVFAVAFFFLFMFQGSTKPIESVAGQFKPSAGWQLVDNQVIPPTYLCFEANCPSVHRSWKTGESLTKEQLQDVLNASGWGFEIEGDCLVNPNIGGVSPLCSTDGRIQKYNVSLVVWGASGGQRGSIVLSVNG